MYQRSTVAAGLRLKRYQVVRRCSSDEAGNQCRTLQPLTNLQGQCWGEGFLRRPPNVLQRHSQFLFRNDGDVGRLREMDHHRPAQGTIKHRVAGLIGEIANDDRSMFRNATLQPNNPGSYRGRNCEQAPDESYPHEPLFIPHTRPGRIRGNRVFNLYWGYKPVSPPRNGFDKSGVASVISKSFPHLKYCHPQAPVELNKGILWPESISNLFPRNNLSGAFHQKEQ